MKPGSATPNLLLVAVTLLCVALAFGTLVLATSFSSLSLRLSPTDTDAVIVTHVHDGAVFSEPGPRWGTVLKAIGIAPPIEGRPADWPAPVPVTSADLLPEPDSLSSYAEYDAFLARQTALAEVMAADAVELHLEDIFTREEFTSRLYTDYREVTALTDGFWMQLITGVAALLISGWVWALRPRHIGPIMFMASAIGLTLSTATSAVYANRELALHADVFALLVPINHLGVVVFGMAMIGLLLSYPRQLVHPRWFWLLPALGAAYTAIDIGHIELGLGPSLLYIFIALAMLGILAAIALQWRATRGSPHDRAALGWLGLSVVAGAGAYTLLGAAPILLDTPFSLPQSHVTSVLVIIYAGLALGLSRYRLFDLGEWSYRVLFYAVGALVLLALDAAIIYLLNLDAAPALGISLLLVAFGYLPMRDWVWHRLATRRTIAQHELFSSALDVAFAPSPAESAARWQALLRQLFDPLQIAEAAAGSTEPQMGEDGLSLYLPAVASAPPLRLTYPFAGRGLFSPAHVKLAENLVSLTVRAEEGREAYMRGVGEERRRMARDLHDDVGARLLTGLHTADETTRPTLQAALSDIRAIVSGLAGEEASLDRVLAETRHEAARRLEAAEIALDWPLAEADIEAVRLDYRLHKALTSAVREIVSNVIRHSGARTFTVTPTLSPGHLALRFADDGKGLPPAALAGETTGFGLRNLRHRLEDIGGHLQLDASSIGTAITLDIPLALTPHTPEPGVPRSAVPLNSPA
jgi:two-component system sensor histidine kinase DevS